MNYFLSLYFAFGGQEASEEVEHPDFHKVNRCFSRYSPGATNVTNEPTGHRQGLYGSISAGREFWLLYVTFYGHISLGPAKHVWLQEVSIPTSKYAKSRRL